ncbi:MAG TPA: pyroglutamyl-peptidase I [Opitutaceae bacterium]|nr:pyroglutamyl-peptidase I [Opitutaceae bacterium]
MNSRTKTVLITGFEPFGGDTRNPSQEIARALDGRVIAGGRIVGAVLPCAFGSSVRALRALIRRERPDVVIALGLANTRQEITPERIAINLDDARIRDNAGRQPADRPVVRGGPAAYWSTLPVKPIVAALAKQGFPASVSHSAGTFVCNHVFYALLHDVHRSGELRASGSSAKRSTAPAARRHRGPVAAGFIHVPWPSDAAATPRSGIPLVDQIAAIELAASVSLRGLR